MAALSLSGLWCVALLTPSIQNHQWCTHHLTKWSHQALDFRTIKFWPQKRRLLVTTQEGRGPVCKVWPMAASQAVMETEARSTRAAGEGDEDHHNSAAARTAPAPADLATAEAVMHRFYANQSLPLSTIPPIIHQASHRMHVSMQGRMDAWPLHIGASPCMHWNTVLHVQCRSLVRSRTGASIRCNEHESLSKYAHMQVYGLYGNDTIRHCRCLIGLPPPLLASPATTPTTHIVIHMII